MEGDEMMDEEKRLISIAVKNWQARFMVAGVHQSDFTNFILPGVDSWLKWGKAWEKTGDRHYQLAEEALAQGRKLTSGEAYARAAVYYHFAQFTLMNHPEFKKELTLKKVEAYKKAAPMIKPAAERVEIPFEDTFIPGYLRRPEGEDNPRVVILIPGADSVKEEFRTLEEYFLKRGMATVSMDGPGQGEMRYQMLLRADYEKAVSAVIDYLEDDPRLDTRKIGVCGISMGGTYAIRAAAHDTRIGAAVDNAGFYHIDYWDELGALLKDTLSFLFAAADEKEAREKAYQIDLREAIKDIRCPLMIVHGKLDRIVPVEDAEKMYQLADCEKELVIYPEGNHVCNNISYKYRPLIADWIKSKLQ